MRGRHYQTRSKAVAHTKIAGKQVLRKGLSPLATTISTGQARARGKILLGRIQHAPGTCWIRPKPGSVEGHLLRGLPRIRANCWSLPRHGRNSEHRNVVSATRAGVEFLILLEGWVLRGGNFPDFVSGTRHSSPSNSTLTRTGRFAMHVAARSGIASRGPTRTTR